MTAVLAAETGDVVVPSLIIAACAVVIVVSIIVRRRQGRHHRDPAARTGRPEDEPGDVSPG